MKIGFDNELYLKLQSENILKRMEKLIKLRSVHQEFILH